MAKSLLRSSVVFSAMTLVSRVLGLVRDTLLARYFDVVVTDAFFAALRIPNTLRRFFAEGGFANAFVPVFSATKTQQPEQLRDLLAHTIGTLLTLLVGVTVLGVLGSAVILQGVAFGLVDNPEQFLLAEQMLRIMFAYILFISLTALAGGVLNAHGQFALPAITPVILNVTLIAAALWRRSVGVPPVGMYGIELAWAVLLGGVLQLAIQLPFLWRLGLLVRPRWGYHAGVRRMLRLMVPTLFGSSVGQLTVLMNTFLASMLVTGSISWLYYSDRLVELPVALIGVALGTVILPRLSALKASQDFARFVLTLDWALRWALLLGSAAATGLVVLAPSVLATLFLGGRFDEVDLQMSMLSLRAYGIGVLFLTLVKILAPAFYARQDTKTPVKAGLVAMAVNMVAAIVLGRYFAHVGLALASTLASVVNVMILWGCLQADGVRFKLGSLWFVGQVVVANGVMAWVLWYVQGEVVMWVQASMWWRIGHLLLTIAIGVMVYFMALWVLGLRKQQLRLGA